MKKMKQSGNQLLCFFLVCISYCFSTFSSPFYPTNPWVDTNAMLTVGRSWLHGLIPFKDIFEQRGPTMYFLYYLAAKISEKNFLGVFLIELFFGLVGFFFLAKIAQLFLGNKKTSYWVALTGFSVFITSTSFRYGGSPEEFSVPFILGLLFITIYRLKRNKDFTSIDLFFQGISVGFVFWMKYSLIGAWIGFFLYVGFYFLWKRQWKEFALRVLSAFAGFCVITTPVVVYFLSHQAFSDLIDIYFRVNLSSYTSKTSGIYKLFNIFSVAFRNFSPHILESALMLLALIVLIFSKKIKMEVKILFCSIFLFELFFVYISMNPYRYYFLPFTAFAEVIIMVFIIFGSKKLTFIHSKRKFAQLLLCFFLLFINASHIISPYSQGDKFLQKNIRVTKAFRNKMFEVAGRKDFSLLQMGSIDEGFYLATNTLPKGNYFENPNIPYTRYPKIIDSQLEMIKNKTTEFVVITPYRKPVKDFLKGNPHQFTTIALNHKEVQLPKILLENYQIIDRFETGAMPYLLLIQK